MVPEKVEKLCQRAQQAIAGLAQALCGKGLPTNGKEKSRGWALFSRR